MRQHFPVVLSDRAICCQSQFKHNKNMKKLLNPKGSERPLLKFNLKMKLTTLLLISTFIGLFANDSYAQKTKVTLDLENATVRNVIENIQSTTDFLFLYKIKDVDLERRVSLKANKENIETILKNLFGTTNTSYKIRGVQIILRKDQNPTKEIPKQAQKDGPQDKLQVTGTVIDERGIPLLGASIIERNTTNGVSTDFDGKYSITVSNSNATLVFTYIGYGEQIVPVNGRSTIDLTLEPESQSLDEVVIMGYSSERKSDLSGSTSSVQAEEIQKVVAPSIDQALQGRAAGLLVSNSTGGSPGAAPKVRIRGSNSVNSGNEPLYVIDGLPVYPDNEVIRGSSDFQTDQLSPSTSNVLATINPNDIESVEVLKDASATAIYGSRGANGVIVITTKRGSDSKNQMNVDIFTGVSSVSKEYPLLNASQYAKLLNEYNSAFGGNPAFTNEQIAAFESQGGTDWQSLIFRQAFTKSIQVSSTGGNKNLQHFLSSSYYNEEGVIKGSDLERFSVRANIDVDLGEKFRLGNSFTTSYTIQNDVPTGQRGPGTGPGIVVSAINFPPTDPIYKEDGSYFLFPSRSDLAIANPLAIAETQELKIKSLRTLGTFFLEYEFLPGLTGKINLGYDLLSRKEDAYFPKESTLLGAETGGTARVGNILDVTWLTDFLLSYNKVAGDHRINGVVGFSAQANTLERTLTGRSNFVTDAFGTFNLAGGSTEIIPQSAKDDWSLVGLLGRVNYIFDDRYIFTFSGRYDGSSRFGENNKFAFFPSGAVAWRLSNESFMENAEFVNNLKLRGSYGITGNQEIGLYRSLPRYETVGEVFGNTSAVGIRPAGTGIPNPDLTWEQTSQLDVGVDFQAWKGKLNFTADYYKKETTDLIFEFPVASESGYSGVLRNSGSVENEGIEFTVGSRFNLGKVGVSVDANYSHNKNWITDLGGRDTLLLENGGAYIIGQDITSLYGLQFDGIWQLGEESQADAFGRVPGDIKYQDLNGDNTYSLEGDRKVFGVSTPTAFYGLNTSFDYQDFELSIFFMGTSGNMIRGGTVNSAFSGLGNTYVASKDYWSPTNPSNTIHSLTSNDPLGNNIFTSHEFEKADFIRLRNVMLAYNFPRDVLNKLGMANLKIYISGQNLWTITNYTGQDPEVVGYTGTGSGRQFNPGNYPSVRTYRFGLNIGL